MRASELINELFTAKEQAGETPKKVCLSMGAYREVCREYGIIQPNPFRNAPNQPVGETIYGVPIEVRPGSTFRVEVEAE